MDGTEVWAYYYPRLLFQRDFCSYAFQSMSIVSIPSPSSVGIIHGILNRPSRGLERTIGNWNGTMTSLSRALGSALARQAGTVFRNRVHTAMRNFMNEAPRFLLTPRAGLRGMRRRIRTLASQASGPASQYASPSFTFSLPPSQPRARVYTPGGMRLLPIYRARNLDRRRYRRRRSRRSRR